VHFINQKLPDDAVVYLLYLSGRGYYLDREYLHHAGLETAVIKAMVRSSADTDTLKAFLKSLGGTHLLVRDELLMKTLEDNFPAETVHGFLEKLAQCLIKVYEANGHSVYRITCPKSYGSAFPRPDEVKAKTCLQARKSS
jgi:hypothetical protein